MATPPQATPPISPDGHYWWDGQAWQPMPQPAPPPPAPAPVTAPAEDRPSWLAAPPTAVAAPAPQPAPMYEQTAAAPPAWEPPAAGPAPWEPPVAASKNRLMIYAAGFLILAVLAGGGAFVYSQLRTNPENAAYVQVSPSPVISDYERADRFLNVDMGPGLVETNQAIGPVSQKCTASLPPSCKDALITLNKAMIDLDEAMTSYQRDIPVCIGRQVQQFKDDWNGMEQGVSAAIGGFDANNRTLILQGLQKFAAIAQYLKPDITRINQAEQTCAKTV